MGKKKGKKSLNKIFARKNKLASKRAKRVKSRIRNGDPFAGK